MIEAIAWPIATLLLGAFALLLFRSPINKKIEGLTRAGKDGVAWEQPSEKQNPPQEKPKLSFEELMKEPISHTARERERFIENRLKELNIHSEAERIVLLQRLVATTGVEFDFFKISHIIFGSQVSFMIQLAGTHGGLPNSAAEVVFGQARLQYPEIYANRTFEEWLGYIVTSNLVQVSKDQIDLTKFGSDFLKYLVDARLAYERRG